jgi:hypothetical protein
VRTTIIQGIPVATDSVLSQKHVKRLVTELKQTLAWEGRKVDRIEIRHDGQLIELLAYEKTALQVVDLNQVVEE